jgi:hypothetical protein
MFNKLIAGSASLAALLLIAGQSVAQPAPDAERQRINVASEAERARELALLHITQVQPTKSARDVNAPDFANFDESKANPYPMLPALMVMNSGQPVTTPAQWQERRKEIFAMFDREIYGRMPANVPGVTWKVTETTHETIGGIPVITKKLVGHADNSGDPSITVDILMNVTTPEASHGKGVPVVVNFGSVHPRPFPAGFTLAQPPLPDYREQLLLKGWGFAILDTSSIQADNGAGLNEGIIGLTNHGKPRSLEDWGVLRAWAWGASRGIDYLETDQDVDAKKLAIFGHSRGGKAALVALAYEPRFATGFISSSGAGGAALYRRNFGEGIPNLDAIVEYHWFAGEFLKYDAVGRTPNELPVDAHELIALVAPRPVFIGGGNLMLSPPNAVPGDGWVDSRGMFMAAAAASPVWTLLGRPGLQTTEFPPLLTYLGDGDIGFRQHEFGHTPLPNWSYFIEFASKYFN